MTLRRPLFWRANRKQDVSAPVESVLDRLSLGATVLVIRLRSLGDIVLATPALQLLRQRRSDVWITVAVDRALGPILQDNPVVDQVIPIDHKLPYQTIKKIRSLHPELCWNLHGGSSSAWMTLLSGAQFQVGYKHFSKRFVYNVRIPRAQEILQIDTAAAVHTAEHHAAGAFYLGADRGEIPASMLKSVDATDDAPYAVLHVAASHETKRWPGSRFVELAHWLADTRLLEVRVIAGPGQEQLLDQFGDFEALPSLNVGEVAELIANASLFVGNDSGPAHIAAAYQLPTVVIFGDSDSKIWGPWKTPHAIVEARPIDSVSVKRVKRAVDQLMPALELLEFSNDVDRP